MNDKVAIIGGGTVSPIANHLQLCAFAKGGTSRRLYNMFKATKLIPRLYLSRMAESAGSGDFHTNKDLQQLIDKIKSNSQTKMIVLTAAICDFICPGGSESLPRPDTSSILTIELDPAEKIISSIRDEKHKHIFLVAFKNTVNLSPREMYLAGLDLCKKASANLVFVNDTETRHNMIVTPEEATYADGFEREDALRELVDISIMRSHLSFTRSTVVAGDPIPWDSELVPHALRTVVDHCIGMNAYKPFNGATVGHFACKLDDNTFLTSKRKTNFNDLARNGLVKVVTDGPDNVIAYGAKPSVGGQSQRIVFNEHEGMDCIVHFHCPLKENNPDDIEIRSQREVECGSHECGQNTSSGLKQFGNLKAVMLSNHGPNIVFSKDIDPQEVIEFIHHNFDLSEKTGGYNLLEKELVK